MFYREGRCEMYAPYFYPQPQPWKVRGYCIFSSLTTQKRAIRR